MKNHKATLWPAIEEKAMKCQRCVRGEEATCRVRSDVIDMKVCAACAGEARRLGLAVEVLDGRGRKGTGEKSELELRNYRSERLAYGAR
jgi:hypothetical protein